MTIYKIDRLTSSLLVSRFEDFINLKTRENSYIVLICTNIRPCRQKLLHQYFNQVVVTKESCDICGPGFLKLQFELKEYHLGNYLQSDKLVGKVYTTCVRCDKDLFITNETVNSLLTV